MRQYDDGSDAGDLAIEAGTHVLAQPDAHDLTDLLMRVNQLWKRLNTGADEFQRRVRIYCETVNLDNAPTLEQLIESWKNWLGTDDTETALEIAKYELLEMLRHRLAVFNELSFELQNLLEEVKISAECMMREVREKYPDTERLREDAE